MIQAVGIDWVLISRFQQLVRLYPKQLNRIFTPRELTINSQKKKTAILAEIFAVKEAVFKVLGTGWQKGISWTDIEVFKSKINLKGKAAKIAKELKIKKILFDASSTNMKAAAQALGIK